jgi:hypothetical protein
VKFTGTLRHLFERAEKKRIPPPPEQAHNRADNRRVQRLHETSKKRSSGCALPCAIMRSTRSLTSLSLSSSASHQMTWCGVRGVAAFQPPRPAAAGDRNPSSGVPRVRAMKNPARFPGPGLGALLKDIFLYMNPVATSRSHKLHHAKVVFGIPRTSGPHAEPGASRARSIILAACASAT